MKPLPTKRAISITISVAVLYFLIFVLLPNIPMLGIILQRNDEFSFKWMLFSDVVSGAITSLSLPDLLITLCTAFLFGVNCYLFWDSFTLLKKSKKVTLSFGGAGFLGLAASGCSSCGISILSVLGLTSAFSNLPFHGREVQMVTIILLGISIVIAYKRRNQACLLNNSN